MMNRIDMLLDHLTMYRLLLYYLLVLLGTAIVMGLFHVAAYSPFAILVSAGLLVAVCWGSNRAFAWFLKLPHNPESSLITALILSLIITPTSEPKDLLFPLMAGVLAMASKYLLTFRGKHIFNPAAVAVVLTALGPHQTAGWWIGSAAFMPFVVLGGLLVARKLRVGLMVGAFLAASILTMLAFGGGELAASLKHLALDSPVWFLGFVMLTEPMTSPATRTWRMIYGAVVGAVSAPLFHVGTLYFSPELALVIGNALTFVGVPQVRQQFTLERREKVAPDIADFVFKPARPFAYRPGQYLEWTLPHHHTDSRGSRRYFTLASSPTEDTVRIGVKFYKDSSTYKHELAALRPGGHIMAAQLGGDFVLPKDQSRKLAFLAAGIGITPYRSMLKYLVDTNDRRDIVLVYGERTLEELAYRDVLAAAAKQLGTRLVYTLSEPAPDWTGPKGRISAELVAQMIPDYHERLFYISGPQAMVQATRRTLHGLGVPAGHIRTDFFPGYA